MDKIELRKKATILRKQGKTYSEIQKELRKQIPKSTLSYWCRNIKLPSWYNDKIRKINNKNLNRAQKIALVINRKKRETFLEYVKSEASKTILLLDERNLKIILATLYLGEGAKWKGHSGLMLGSSDPNIILLYLELLKRCYNIKPNKIKCRICYRVDQDIKKLERFWSKITNISLKNFYKTKPDPRTFGKKTLKKDYKGVCVLMCKGSDIQLELEQITNLLLEKLRAHSLEEKR